MMMANKILLPHQYYYPHMDLLADKSSIKKENSFFSGLDTSKSKEAVIYVHIPFCDSKCAFCGFDKVRNLNEINGYANKLHKEFQFYSSKKYVQHLKITGIHFGGGTPTILPKNVFSGLINDIKNQFNIADNVVVNVEGSATTLYKEEVIEFIKENNVSRVSVGVQTFYEKLREQYKSKATLEEVYLTLSKMKENNIMTYIDIMYGFPDFGIGNMKEIVESDIKKAIELDVEGIDFGQLYPFGNSLGKKVSEENLKIPSMKQVIDTIDSATHLMESAGYEQKTAYGFTKKGKIIIETSYYGGVNAVPDCLAFGSSAFGFVNGYKYRNSSYNSYIKDSGLNFSQLKKLSDEELENINVVGFPKLLMLSKDALTENMYEKYESKLKYLLDAGFLEEDRWFYKLTKKGKSFIDNVYYFMIDDHEKAVVNRQIKMLVLN